MQWWPSDPDTSQSVVMKLSHGSTPRTRFKDCAILYRGSHRARLFEQRLREPQIPYAISGGRSTFELPDQGPVRLPAPDRQRG